MRKFERLPEPTVLKDNWGKWGEKYQQKRLQNPAYEFRWPSIKNTPLNQLLREDLLSQTQHHCSYCDKYPLDGRGDHTIDHFRPKSHPDFYQEVCHWHNLYIACNGCQSAKKVAYSELFLRPDATDYSFEKYFIYNYLDDSIDIREDISTVDKNRAIYTRDTLGLNDLGLRKAREKARKLYAVKTYAFIDDYDFRYLFDLDFDAAP